MAKDAKRGKKTTGKTAGKPQPKAPEKIPQPHGGALNSGGTPGNRGGPGRPPQAFKSFCAELARSEEFQEALRVAATSPLLKSYGSAAKLVIAYAEGLPTQPVEQSGAVTVRVIREDRPIRRDSVDDAPESQGGA